MTGPEVLPALGEAVGHLLAFVFGWAALFFVGPVACLVLLALQVAGASVPDGAGWVYAATAGAWLLALGGFVALRATARAADAASRAVAAALGPLTEPRKKRVIVVDAATGRPLDDQPGWDWGARREAEYDEWSRAAARAREAWRVRQAAREAAPDPATRVQPPRAEPRAAPPRQAEPPRRPGSRSSSGAARPPQPEARSPRASAPPPRQPPPAPPLPAAPDPWLVLGLARGASPGAVKTAYRDLIKQYHPDRVAGMPREFQAIAHEKTREIRQAYEALAGRQRH